MPIDGSYKIYLGMVRGKDDHHMSEIMRERKPGQVVVPGPAVSVARTLVVMVGNVSVRDSRDQTFCCCRRPIRPTRSTNDQHEHAMMQWDELLFLRASCSNVVQ